MDQDLSNKNYSFIKDDAILKIDVSGKYYHELKKVFVVLVTNATNKEEMLTRFTSIVQGKVSTPEEHMLHLMYALIMEIENLAEGTNMVDSRPLDINPSES